MESIYQRALGSDFKRLHPNIRQRFALHSRQCIACIGKGTMETVWQGNVLARPFFHASARRHMMFPEQGKNIPFTIENYAYLDRFGRETVLWIRTFQFPKKARRFDAAMIFSEQRQTIVDYLGTHQQIAVDIDCSVTADGGIRLRSGEQRLYGVCPGIKIPAFFMGQADVCEWYDDQKQVFRIEVRVTNPVWGPLLGYRGAFTVHYRKVSSGDIPLDTRPFREEERE